MRLYTFCNTTQAPSQFNRRDPRVSTRVDFKLRHYLIYNLRMNIEPEITRTGRAALVLMAARALRTAEARVRFLEAAPAFRSSSR